MSHPSGLSDRQVAEIQDKWRTRTTIASLAEAYNISPDMVRKIIGALQGRE